MRIVVASGNRGKLAELMALLAPLGIEVISQAHLGIGSAPEDRPTFVENALTRHATPVAARAFPHSPTTRVGGGPHWAERPESDPPAMRESTATMPPTTPGSSPSSR